MSRRNLSKLALMGLTSGVILSGDVQGSPPVDHVKDLDQMLAVINAQTYCRHPHSGTSRQAAESGFPVEQAYIHEQNCSSVNHNTFSTNPDKAKPSTPNGQAIPQTPAKPAATQNKTNAAASKALPTKSEPSGKRFTAEKVVKIKEGPVSNGQGDPDQQTAPATPKPSQTPKPQLSNRNTTAGLILTAEKVVQIKDSSQEKNTPAQTPAQGQPSGPSQSDSKKDAPQSSLSFAGTGASGWQSYEVRTRIIAAEDVKTHSPLKDSNEEKGDQGSGKDEKAEYDNDEDPSRGNMGYHLLTEDELMLELTEQGLAMYKQLSPEGKQLALKVASARCNGTNECRKLNACRTEKNDCAGKGECKGQGKCALSDKNLAVKLVYDKLMSEKRAKLNQPSK